MRERLRPSRSQLTTGQTLDTARNRILDFSLRIEAENPEAGEAVPGTQPIPRDRVQTIFQNTFYGSVGNIAQNGQDFTQMAK